MHGARARALPNDEKCNIPRRKRYVRKLFFRRFSLNGVLARLWRSFGRSKRGSPINQVLLGEGWEDTKGTPEGPRETKKGTRGEQDGPRETKGEPQVPQRHQKKGERGLEERKRTQKRPKESQNCSRDTKRSEKEPTHNATSLCSGSCGHPEGKRPAPFLAQESNNS